MNRLAHPWAMVVATLGTLSSATHAQPVSAPKDNPPPAAPSSTPGAQPPGTRPAVAPATEAPHPPLPDYYRAGDAPAATEPSAAEPTARIPARTERAPRYTPIFEPPPPPPPPIARHVAPRRSLWIGARAGMFSPFGFLWARASESRTGLLYLQGVPWQDYASTGPFLELDAGARLGRNYNVFALWEHAFLPSGGLGERSEIATSLGSTDLWALGARINSDPDTVGVVAELAVGYRQFFANWDDGTSLELTQGGFESRVGLGAEIRLSPTASLTPMLTLAAGTFGRAEWTPDRSSGIAGEDISVSDQQASHGSLTLQIAGHLDLLGVK